MCYSSKSGIVDGNDITGECFEGVNGDGYKFYLL